MIAWYINQSNILYETAKIYFWGLKIRNSVFGLLVLIFTFLTPKIIFLLVRYKIFIILIFIFITILEPKCRFWALRAYICLIDSFLHPYKIYKDTTNCYVDLQGWYNMSPTVHAANPWCRYHRRCSVNNKIIIWRNSSSHKKI
jgi:hypothetical protein